MLIDSINRTSSAQLYINKRNYLYQKNYMDKNIKKYNNINFKGKFDTQLNLSKQVDSIIKDRDFSQKLMNIVKENKGYLGEGLSNKAYSLACIKYPKFVLRVPKITTLNDLNLNFRIVKDPFPNNNFGQAVATNPKGIEILKFNNGISHGVSSDIIENGHLINHEIAIKFLSELRQISNFKDSAYIDLAQQFKIINENNNYFVDGNPNNILVESSKEKFNLIDLIDKNVIPMYENYINDENTMITVLLDSFMHMKLYEKLNKDEQTELEKYSKIIIDKCKNACKEVGIPKSNVPMSDYFDLLMKYDIFIHNRKYSEPWSKKYDKFCCKYSDKIDNITGKEAAPVFKSIIMRIELSEKMSDFYLSFLHYMNLLSDEEIIYIIDNYPNKISEKDLKYLKEKNIVK